jgi:pyruvate/2-oxoglutarate dehydrogenase complex dihydrolipoamide acyltransferase (E2) component
LLNLTTKLLRVLVPLVVFLAWAPAAYAWSWPVQGPVVESFSYDRARPYASGQHRGIDIGADATGEAVVAPEAGTVSFAGTVPTNGECVTIETADGYAVTLTHLGSILVARGATVAEQDPVGTIGPSGTPEVPGPYVHLGIRLAADPNGYLDPLGFLTPASAGDANQSNPPEAQPSAGNGSSAAPGAAPSAGRGSPAAAPKHHANPKAATRPNASHAQTRDSRHRPERVDERRPQTHARAPRGRAGEATRSSRRPVVETAAPLEPIGLGAGHEIRWSAPVERPAPLRRPPLTVPLPLILNGAAALVALAAAFAAARSRRRRLRLDTSRGEIALLLQLPRQRAQRRPMSRAA